MSQPGQPEDVSSGRQSCLRLVPVQQHNPQVCFALKRGCLVMPWGLAPHAAAHAHASNACCMVKIVAGMSLSKCQTEPEEAEAQANIDIQVYI